LIKARPSPQGSLPISSRLGGSGAIVQAIGLPVDDDCELVLPLTFHPAKAGSYHGTYTVTWTDRFGKHSRSVPVAGAGVS
jgi:hypothetical protein